MQTVGDWHGLVAARDGIIELGTVPGIGQCDVLIFQAVEIDLVKCAAERVVFLSWRQSDDTRVV